MNFVALAAMLATTNIAQAGIRNWAYRLHHSLRDEGIYVASIAINLMITTRPAVADHRDGRLLPRHLRIHGLHRRPLRHQHCPGSSAGDLAEDRPGMGDVWNPGHPARRPRIRLHQRPSRTNCRRPAHQDHPLDHRPTPRARKDRAVLRHPSTPNSWPPYQAISDPAAGLQRLSSTSQGSTVRSANSSAPTTTGPTASGVSRRETPG